MSTTYITFKKVIINQKNKGTLDVESTFSKLDIFLMGDRISEEEYKELITLINE